MVLTVFSSIFYLLIKILPGIQAVEIDIQNDHPDLLLVFYSNSNKFREGATSAPMLINEKRSKVNVSLAGTFANSLRIDLGGQAGTAKIYQMKISSYFSAPLILGPGEISRLFAGGPDTVMQVLDDHVQVIAKGTDPFLIGKAFPFSPMYWQAGLVALIAASLVRVTFLRHLQPMADRGLSLRTSAAATTVMPERFDALEGLRGLAAIMVIADHTWGWFRGVGTSGVWIFFALSGFLLTRSFLDNPRAVLSVAYMNEYFRRRFMRMLPMYYVYIVVVYVISGRLNLAVMHGLFLEGDGHLWALPQEVAFFLLLPMVIVLIVLPLRKYPKTTLVSLFLAMAIWNRFVGKEMIWLLGMEYIKLPLFFGVFLAGVFFSFLYFHLSAAPGAASRLNRVAGGVASPLGFAIIILFFLFSTGHIIDQKLVYSQQYFSYYGFLAGFLIFCILCSKERLLDKFLTLVPFRELGAVGLSLYLVHPIIKNLIDNFCIMIVGYKIKNAPLFLATLLCSYIIAKGTFTSIEQPCFLEKTSK